MKTNRTILFLFMAALMLSACQKTENNAQKRDSPDFTLEEVAKIMTELPIGISHVDEVFSAVNASSFNGYDEEYMFTDLLTCPGAGVGDSRNLEHVERGRRASMDKPGAALKDLFTDYFAAHPKTKAGGAEESLRQLMESDIQIYWPYSEDWDGETFPIVTFDPGDGQESNIGYELCRREDGQTEIRSVVVTEDVARERPVWVVNRNDDSEYNPIRIFEGQKYLVCGDGKCMELDADGQSSLKGAVDGKRKVLKVKAFNMLRNYDSWFAGASEFWIKCGSINGFRAATEEELAKYTPSVTDCMVVVKRSQVGRNIPLGIVLLTDFTEQMENIAFLITEDDGGTVTEWKCEATVKIKSRSWGININIPYRSEDDIVWRGQLSRDYLAESRYTVSRLGDVKVTFEME